MIRINVISKSFWDEISRIFGSSVASLGRALLPFTLKDKSMTGGVGCGVFMNETLKASSGVSTTKKSNNSNEENVSHQNGREKHLHDPADM